MGLIVFTYFLGLLLTADSVHLLFSRSKPINKALLPIALPAAMAAISSAVSIHLIFHGIISIQRVTLITALCCILLASYSLFRLSYILPLFTENKRFKGVNIFIHSVGVLLIILYAGALKWDALLGFTFTSPKIFGSIRGIYIFLTAYLFIIPLLSITLSLIKGFKIKNNIHVQQLLIHSFAILISLMIWAVMAYLFTTFSCAFTIVPLGYIFILMIEHANFSVTHVFDKKEIILALIRFMLFTVLFAIIAAFLIALVMSHIRNPPVLLAIITILTGIILLIRDRVIKKMSRSLGKMTDYEPVLEKALQKIGYTQGKKVLFDTFPTLLNQYVTCKGIDILISSEAMRLETVYSDLNHKHTIDAHLPCFVTLLDENTVIITRTQTLSNNMDTELKKSLLNIFDTTNMEVLILIREGQNVIGCILLARKRLSAAYTPYDIETLSHLYSYFFLIIYYLRNIAKQDVIVTVDREIEMSNQIINSIQNYKDIFESDTLSMESVSYSAHRLGGDFIDYIKLTDTRSLIIMGDVAGKGLSASMSMVVLKSIIHTYLKETSDFKTLISRVNLFIKKSLPRGTFFAGLFGIIDFSENALYYINCGIPLMAMYINSYNNVIEIQGEGRVLGFVKDITSYIKVRKITMHKGDVLAITTDGLLEGENLKGERYGSNRMIRMLEKKNDLQGLEIATAIYNSLSDFILREIGDDITILVLKYN